MFRDFTMELTDGADVVNVYRRTPGQWGSLHHKVNFNRTAIIGVNQHSGVHRSTHDEADWSLFLVPMLPERLILVDGVHFTLPSTTQKAFFQAI